MEKAKRYLVFLVGLFISSLGVSLITKANLGTSPISAIPYVLSLNFPLTLGQFTIAFSLLLILLQLLILRKNFKLEHLLQIPISVAFGYFIDMTMGLLTFVAPQSYPAKVLYLLIGCVVLAFGVYLEVLGDVAMLPGESFVRAIVMTWKTDFGTTKVCFDVSMTVIAVVLSFLLAGQLAGVREGTLIAALLVGFIARLFGRALYFMPGVLFGAAAKQAEPAETPGGYVIAIGRQYGAGGRVIGKQLAEKLGYAFYDEEILQMAAGTTGYTCCTTWSTRCTLTHRSRSLRKTRYLKRRKRPFWSWRRRATACWWAAAPTGCCARTPTACGSGSMRMRTPGSAGSWTSRASTSPLPACI